MSFSSFAELGLSERVVDALADRDITEPFAIQRLVVPDALAGHDVLAKSPTGSGKTLAFVLPILHRIRAKSETPAALVLAPTRELALQIVEEARTLAAARGLRVAAAYGGVGIERQAQRARRAHLLVATPGRLLDLLDRGALELSRVRILVLDEADRMLDMGFRPDVERILDQLPSERQTMLFSATLDGEVATLAGRYTDRARRHDHAPPPEQRGTVDHRFVPVAHEDKLDTLLDHLEDADRGRTLVFVRTKRGADRLVKRLNSNAVDAVAMHGDKSQAQREKALARFEAGHVDVLVATDVAARGIDVADITHVINFDAPEDREGYVHRIGRTARAGAEGVGVTFVMRDQARDMGKIAHELELHREFSDSGYEVPRPQRQAAPTRPRQAARRRSGRR